MSVNGRQLPPNSDMAPSFVRSEKICTFADVEECIRYPRAGGFHPINTLIHYGKSYIFAG